jgi:hypothetical protein
LEVFAATNIVLTWGRQNRAHRRLVAAFIFFVHSSTGISSSCSERFFRIVFESQPQLLISLSVLLVLRFLSIISVCVVLMYVSNVSNLSRRMVSVVLLSLLQFVLLNYQLNICAVRTLCNRFSLA